MAEAMKCDRCGKFYEDNTKVETEGRIKGGTIGGVATTTKRGEWDRDYDLCDECVEAFKRFMKGEKK